MRVGTTVRTCTKCGRELSAAAPYCPGCGMRQSDRVEGATSSTSSLNHHPTSSARLAMANIGGASALAWLDDWVTQRLRLDPATRIQLPTLLCESGEEFYGALFKDEALTPAQMTALLKAELEAARSHAASGGGIWGVFLANQGCLLNGWLYQQVFGLKKAANALNDARVKPMITATAAHEKWGHGFLSSMTALGKETKDLHAERWRHARNFPEQTTNTPEGLLLRERWHAVFGSTRYAEEGWATWIERLVTREQKSEERAAPDFKQLSVVARKAGGADAEGALTALLDPAQPPDTATQGMAWWEEQEAALTSAFEAAFGQPPRYVVGHALCRLIEQRAGEQGVVTSLLIAGNLRLNLAGMGVSDLKDIVLQNPALNMNRRLAAIAHLPLSPKLNPTTLARLAHDQLGFATPEGLPS